MQIAMDKAMICLSEDQVTPLSELDDIEGLVRIYRPRLLRYVTFSINDADLAETITQDCLLKAYKGRASFRGDCSVSTWLFSIANNLVRDHLRTKKFQFWRKARATAVDVTEMAGSLPSGETSPERRMLASERAAQVGELVAQLSDKQRQVFTLRFNEEMELHDIAEALGMPVNTVKTHLHRAVTSIRKKLGGAQ